MPTRCFVFVVILACDTAQRLECSKRSTQLASARHLAHFYQGMAVLLWGVERWRFLGRWGRHAWSTEYCDMIGMQFRGRTRFELYRFYIPDQDLSNSLSAMVRYPYRADADLERCWIGDTYLNQNFSLYHWRCCTLVQRHSERCFGQGRQSERRCGD